MKNRVLTIILLSVLLGFGLGLTACKKDALKVKEDKTFAETAPSWAYDTMPNAFTGLLLTLKPNGSADVVTGGDIVQHGTYDIDGKRLHVTTQAGGTVYNFTIVSPEELHSSTGITLKLVKK